MKQAISFFAMQCLLSSRSKQALFWSFLYPLVMLVLMMSVFGTMGAEEPGADPRLMLLSGVMVITIMSTSILPIATVIPMEREQGIYKRLRVTDLTRLHVIFALLARQALVVLMGVALVVIFGNLLFSVSVNGEFFALLVIVMIGSILFFSVGLVISNLIDHPQASAAVSNIIFLLMMFLSGSTFPKALFPEWLAVVSKALPASYLYDLVESSVYYDESIMENIASFAILSSIAVVALVVAIATFRWESK